MCATHAPVPAISRGDISDWAVGSGTVPPPSREDLTMIDNILWDAIQSNDTLFATLQFIVSGVK